MNHTTRWTAQKISQRLALINPLVYRSVSSLTPFRFRVLNGPLETPPIGRDVDDADWPTIQPNSYWAGWQTDFTLRTTFSIPGDWPSAMPVALHLPIGKSGDFEHPEALAYVDGVAYATVDRHHPEIILREEWRDGRVHSLALHGWTGLGGWMNDETHTKLFMHTCAVVQIDMATRDFIATARAALGIANALDVNHPAKGCLLTALDEGFKSLDTREPFCEGFYASVPAAHAALMSGITKAGAPLDVDIFATGHSHIDVAWLWTLGQTRLKAGRTFHNVLRLMENFPDYHFTQSQPQLYDYVRQDYPELFTAIQQRVTEGRWEPIGGMWVEADCNVSGAESLARQFILGRSFFHKYFGRQTDSPVLWLPDVFGYAWNLPQLIRQAGLEFFFTIKIGWNQYNRLPYDSFWWQGLDGTRVLTHFSTTPELGSQPFASTYNAQVTPGQVLGTWTNFQQKDLSGPEGTAPLLMAFGYGDGGGGPTREMLENLRELACFPATPRIHQASVTRFFRKLETLGEQLPTWNGELYLELHRGTYTTQSRNKRANRQSEFLLHDCEFLATLASLQNPETNYPHAQITQAWELICLNQFHDIIPGSSIGPVYTESQQQYAQIRQIADSVREASLCALASSLNASFLMVNPTSFTRHDLAFFSGSLDRLPAGLDTQIVEGGVLLDCGEIQPYSVSPISKSGSENKSDGSLSVSINHLENNFLRAEFNASGDLTRLLDKTALREVIPQGAVANQWQAFEDRPNNWDAWDVDISYDDKMWLAEPAESIRVVESGPLRATLEIQRRILNSSYTQRISLTHTATRLDFHTVIDWREKHIFLKVAFPVEVLSPVATYEIQWGNVQRPTHRNTSWDWARFETCAHKWVDLSEGSYGVSMLNDSKYGHDIRDNVIRLSLLRSTTSPDPHADEGRHEFTYSLLPHIGALGVDTVREAYTLNDPLIVWAAGSGQTTSTAAARETVGIVSTSAPNIVIETVKRSEDGNSVVIRLYECMRKRGPVTLNLGFDVRAVWHTNLLEENQEELTLNGQQLALNVKPYEIITLRLDVR
jgi:alpha-mannosidase